MRFSESIKSTFGKYATFSGRAARSEYWWWFLFLVIVMLITSIIDGMIIAPLLGFEPFGENAGEPLSALVSLGLFLPSLAVAVRRLHDLDKVGWWLLISFIPIIGVLVLIYWFVQRGTVGANAFGQDPLLAHAR